MTYFKIFDPNPPFSAIMGIFDRIDDFPWKIILFAGPVKSRTINLYQNIFHSQHC